MAARLLISAFLLSFTLFLTNILFAQNCNCLNGWNYRIPITITNNNPSAYNNFELRNSINTLMLISAGKMKSDGSDIRFTDSLCNPLNYYIESGINTNAAIIWVKVSNLPSGGVRTIYMYYGNPSAAGQSSAANTFSFYEGFDNNTIGRFANICSSGTFSVTFTNGLASFSWSESAVWVSDISFSNTEVFTAEANVTAASGSFPGLFWARSVSPYQNMALLMGLNLVRISKAPVSGTGYCVSHNFTIPNYPAVNSVGIWAFTWVSTGSQKAAYPGAGTWTVSDNELPKDVPLKICLGGIQTGSGSYTIDWVRARKYASNVPVPANGTESSIPKSPGNSLTATALGSSTIRVNWADSSNNETKFVLERSLNGGANWNFRDSVAANTTQFFDNGLVQNTQYCYRVFAVNCIGPSAYSNPACSTTSFIGIIKTSTEIPKEFRLYQNYPNPFNPSTLIRFEIPLLRGVDGAESARRGVFVLLTVYDITGRMVYELVNEQLAPGKYSVDWNASSFSSGIYFCRLKAGEYIEEMKMVVLK